MRFAVRAITLDLDDTIWPIAPVILRAENALGAWLREHAPRTAALFPLEAMRVLRDEVAAEHPQLAHDFTRQRLISLERMLEAAGDDLALVQPAFLAARVPLAALSNGNADLERIGLMHVFAFQLGAREHGAAKPAASIFHAACERLQCPPGEVLHVGDDIEMDVLGARRAGLRSCWLNRPDATGRQRDWPEGEPRPDLEVPTLAALADWLEASPHPTQETP